MFDPMFSAIVAAQGNTNDLIGMTGIWDSVGSAVGSAISSYGSSGSGSGSGSGSSGSTPSGSGSSGSGWGAVAGAAVTIAGQAIQAAQQSGQPQAGVIAIYVDGKQRPSDAAAMARAGARVTLYYQGLATGPNARKGATGGPWKAASGQWSPNGKYFVPDNYTDAMGRGSRWRLTPPPGMAAPRGASMQKTFGMAPGVLAAAQANAAGFAPSHTQAATGGAAALGGALPIVGLGAAALLAYFLL